MKNKNIIFDELKEISPLIVQIAKTNVYSVPASYFSNLSADIVQKIKLSNQIFNISLPVTPYDVPKGYFEDLSALIFEKINADQKDLSGVFEETEAIAPILNKISKKPLYTVPDGFFERQLIPVIEDKKPHTKVVSIYKRSKIFRFSAAAAVIISFFSIGLYSITKKYDKAATGNDIAKSKVKNLSKEEIVHFLKSTMRAENMTSSEKPALKNEKEIKSSLKEVSDKEIQQFLKETGESDEI